MALTVRLAALALLVFFTPAIVLSIQQSSNGDDGAIKLNARWVNLNVSVTDETNTKDETTAYVAAVYAAMNELLGGVHEKSYVQVTQVNGAAYGYGGITQEERYVFGKPQSIARRLRAAS